MILLTGRGAFAEEFIKISKAKVISLRKSSQASVISGLKKADCIVHNAANINCRDNGSCVNDNFISTKRLVDLLQKYNPHAKLIYLSSMSVLKSDSEYLPTERMSPYAYSKYLGETYCLRSQFKKVIAVRFSTLFYKDPERDGLSKLIYDAVKKNKIVLYNGGKVFRDFIPLRVAAEYVFKLTCLDKKFVTNKINVASGRRTSFFSVSNYLSKRISGIRIESRKVDKIPKVLSTFSVSNIIALGKIKFSLSREIDDYISLLSK